MKQKTLDNIIPSNSLEFEELLEKTMGAIREEYSSCVRMYDQYLNDRERYRLEFFKDKGNIYYKVHDKRVKGFMP